MSEVVHLDSSALLKRYIQEPWTERVTESFKRAYSGESPISSSLWKVGEVLGALDRAKNQGKLRAGDYALSRTRFIAEARRVNRLGVALIVPPRSGLVADAWALVERYHVHKADALQLVTATEVNSTEFLSGDRALHEAAKAHGLNSVYLG